MQSHGLYFWTLSKKYKISQKGPIFPFCKYFSLASKANNEKIAFNP